MVRRIEGMDPDEYPSASELAQDEAERRRWNYRERRGLCGFCGAIKPDHHENCVMLRVGST
jgi:hypothetical protein